MYACDEKIVKTYREVRTAYSCIYKNSGKAILTLHMALPALFELNIIYFLRKSHDSRKKNYLFPCEVANWRTEEILGQ